MVNNIDIHNQYVIFNLKGESYGIPIEYVETIEKVTEITRVPNAPSYVKGVINLRGEVIPVVDLRRRFEFEEVEATEETRIIILSFDEIVVGILVDSSSEVLTIDKNSIDSTSNMVDSFDEDYIEGIAKIDERMIIIINIPKVIGCETEI